MTLSAQSQVLLPAKGFNANNQIFLQIGFEPEMVTTIGYAHELSNATSKMHLGGSIKLAPLITNNNAYKLNLFTSLNYKLSNRSNILFSPQIYYAHQADRAGTIGGFGFELNTNPYWYGKKWTKSFEFGWQHTAFAYIKHSAITRATFDDRYTTSNTNYPKDGLYHSTANRFKIGFTGAKQISKVMALQFSVGSLVVSQKQKILLGFSHAQVPFYINGMVRYKID
ncbi:MAG: hypothetical protein WKG06_35155 [Segetibacter sp.]